MSSLNLAAAVFICAFVLNAEQDYKPGTVGEYYEYDTEGTPKQRARRKIKHHISHTIKKPFHGTWRSFKVGKVALRKTKDSLENYLRGPVPEEQRAKLNRALTDWEAAMGTSLKHHNKKTPQGLWYVPRQTWRFLRYSLYSAGFRFPRAVKTGMRNIIYNTMGGPAEEGFGEP